MKNQCSLAIIFIVTLLVGLTGCSSETGPQEESGRISISNNPSQLDGRIAHTRSNIVLQSIDGLKDGLGDMPHTFTLVGELLPPETSDGIEMRATFVEVIGNLAYVTYNKEGERYAGGVEVVDISNPIYPVVVSQALFEDTDLAALALDSENSLIYLVGARNPATSGFDSPAVLERMALNNGLLTDITNSFDVQSWAANGIALGDNWICLSSGNATGAGQEGGVGSVGLSGETIDILNWDSFNNSQFIDSDDDRIVALQIGTSAALRVYDRYNTTLNLVATHALAAIGPVDGKNTLDIAGNQAWVAMGDQGVASINLADGSTHNWLNAPDPGNNDPSDYISNGVAVDDDYLYIANGGGGLYVCPLPASNGELTTGGMWDFHSSANAVTAKNDMIFIASGSGGLKILTKTTNTNPLGLAMDFPRDDDSVSMGAPEILMTPNTITLESWCYLREVYDWMGMISYMTDHEGAESGYGFRYINNELRFCLKTDDSAEDAFDQNPGTPVELNQWMHVAGTFDGQTAKMYLNGQLVSEQTISGAIDWDPAPIRFKLGKFYDSNDSRYMNGLLDEVRVWDTARSLEDIQADMNHVLSGHEPGLVGYWNFDNGPNVNVPDLTGNGSDGRLHNIYPENWVESGAGLLQ